jgi:hypothetical protein
MDKAQRAEVLRQRFKEKAGKWQYVTTGRPRPQVEPKPKVSRLDCQSFGLAVSHKWGRTEWLETPDVKAQAELGNRNRKGVPALTTIAAKAPKKLVRTYRDAETLLASRARR